MTGRWLSHRGMAEIEKIARIHGVFNITGSISFSNKRMLQFTKEAFKFRCLS